MSSPTRIRSAREPPRPRKRVPTTIQFPGQPRDRFWEFEDATLALSRIDATTSDLGRLALVEFSTIYGNDWFTFPIPVTYGSMQAVSDLVVRDTFGTHELIAPAADAQWAMYRPAGSSARGAGARRAVRDRGAARRRRRRGGALPARRDGEPRVGRRADRHRRGRHAPRPCRRVRSRAGARRRRSRRTRTSPTG